MDRSAQPAVHLVNGLRRLVQDIRKSESADNKGLTDVVCGETGLLSFGDAGVSYCGHLVEELAEHLPVRNEMEVRAHNFVIVRARIDRIRFDAFGRLAVRIGCDVHIGLSYRRYAAV